MIKRFRFLILVFLCSCQSNDLVINVDDVVLPEIPLFRLDKELFELRDQNFESATAKLESRYGSVYQKYLMNPLRIMGTGDSLYRQSLMAFINDKDIREAHSDLEKLYTKEKVDAIHSRLLDCIKHHKHYFPNQPNPKKIITCQSGWNYAFAYVDSSFIIGLDMYMGEDSRFYQMLSYPKYQTRKMNPDHLLPDVARGWLLSEFDTSAVVNTLANHCVFYGKLFYAVKALLPETEDSLIIGYSAEQMKYCKDYEKKLWGYFAEKNRLFESNFELVRELTSEGPFTGSISKECPPRIAMWVGWQIVKSYMKNNKKVSLEELMTENDALKILNKSRYRP